MSALIQGVARRGCGGSTHRSQMRLGVDPLVDRVEVFDQLQARWDEPVDVPCEIPRSCCICVRGHSLRSDDTAIEDVSGCAGHEIPGGCGDRGQGSWLEARVTREGDTDDVDFGGRDRRLVVE